MKAMILAAGKGTRLQPLTNYLPKPMLTLLGRPVLDAIVELLAGHGVRDIIINTSHLAAEIENYFRDGSGRGIDIAYSFEGHLEGDTLHTRALGSAGGMRKIQDFSGFFDDTFIVLCGDALIDLDISAAVAEHRCRGALATLVMKDVPLDEVHKYGVVVSNSAGRITAFQEKPAPQEALATTVNTGIYIFEPAIFEHIPAACEYDIGGQLFPDLVRKGLPFFATTLPFQWLDIGSLTDYWQANRLLLNGGYPGYPLPGVEVLPGVRAGKHVRANWDRIEIQGPAVIGNGSDIGDGARIIGPTYIGSNCVIEPGARISECLLNDYTRVRTPARLSQQIVSTGFCVQPDGAFVDCVATDLGWLIDNARRPEAEHPPHPDLLEVMSPSA
jgi:mannose-1-phosphate guanylyltransferase